MRPIVLCLSLLLALPVGASEPVEVQAGQIAPISGAICDKECASRIAAKIQAAQESRDKCLGELAEKPSGSPNAWLLGVGGLAGILLGVTIGVLAAGAK